MAIPTIQGYEGVKDMGPVGGPSGTAQVSPAANQQRAYTTSGFFNGNMGTQQGGNPLNDALSGNLAGTTNTDGSDQNAAASFQGVTVDPPMMPPGAVPAKNRGPGQRGLGDSPIANQAVVS